MNRSNPGGLSARILRIARALMPSGRAQWLAAMAAELTAISGPARRVQFALGCFSVALSERARTRPALAWTGRACVALCLFAGSAQGIVLAQRFDTHLARDSIFTLCLVYALAAILALTSLRGLRRLASAGLAGAILGAGWLALAPGPSNAIAAPFLSALALEVAFVMTALLLAGIYLTLVKTPSGGEMQDA